MATVTVQCEIVIDVGDRDPEFEKTVEFAESEAELVLQEAEIKSYLIK